MFNNHQGDAMRSCAVCGRYNPLGTACPCILNAPTPTSPSSAWEPLPPIAPLPPTLPVTRYPRRIVQIAGDSHAVYALDDAGIVWMCLGDTMWVHLPPLPENIPREESAQ